MRRAAALVVPLALLLAGCAASENGTVVENTPEEDAHAAADARAEPDAQETLTFASPCGFRLRHPPDWSIFGTAEDGFVRFASPDGAEAILVVEGPAETMETLGGSLWADAAALRGQTEIERGPTVAFGGDADQVITESETVRLVAVTATFGERGLFALRSHPLGVEPSAPLEALFASIERTPRSEACRPEHPASESDAWVGFRSPDGWSLTHPASWQATSYAPNVLHLETPRNGTDDTFRESLTVVVTPNPERESLEDVANAYYAVLEERQIGFEPADQGYGSLDGRDTAIIYAWEDGAQGREWVARIIDLRDDQIVLFELTFAEPFGESADAMGEVISSFQLDEPAGVA